MYRLQHQAVESTITRDYPNASEAFQNSLRQRKHGNYDTIRQRCERYNGTLSESGGQCSYTPD